MDPHSPQTLRKVEENDPTLTELHIGGRGYGHFNSSDGRNISRLCASIGQNTHVKTLVLNFEGMEVYLDDNSEFFDGLKCNSSIDRLTLDCYSDRGRDLFGRRFVHELLEVYQENSNLRTIRIESAILRHTGGDRIATTLRKCTNLVQLYLSCCNIPDQQLLPIVEAVRGQPSLEILNLYGNGIGKAGLRALASLLSDPISNLQSLNLERNGIDNDGATILANGLANNTQLRELWLSNNQFDNPIYQGVQEVFSKLLCNKSSINSIHASNHALEKLAVHPTRRFPQRSRADLCFLLRLNKGTNKIIPILIWHHYLNGIWKGKVKEI